MRFQEAPSALDVIQATVYFASNRRLKQTQTLALVESAIYCATVDRHTEILQERSSLRMQH